jgi:hypothetical protein
MAVAKDWRGNVVPGNVYELGNTDGIGAPSSPGIQAILNGLKTGNAKIVTAFPYTYGKNGYTATGYTDQQVEPYYMDGETGQHNGGRQMLFMNGKVYPFGTDWNIVPITQTKTVGYWQDEIGTQIPINEEVPTGKYRIRSRADNNIFDELLVEADASGKITGYSPKIYQTGSNSSGFFGSSAFGNILNDIVKMAEETAPIWLPAANLALPGVGTALSAVNTISKGGDIEDILKSAAISQGLSALGNAAAPEVDLNAATSGLQDVYGGNLPIEDIAAAFEPVVPEGVTVGAAIPTPEIVATPLPAIESSVVQPDYFSADAGPLADTTQDIEPVIPPENPFLAGMEETTAIEGAGVAGAANPTGTYTGGANYLSGMEETTATEGAGVAGADNPTGATVTVPGTAQEATKNLTPQQAYQLLKLGAGLFGGAGALTMAAKGLTGGAGALGGLMGSSMPSIQAPTPFTGTYSGMNPYDASYFQQVQQNYNRLFPTTPANVAGPLESWYQTKYVPDTTISNKLFGV